MKVIRVIVVVLFSILTVSASAQQNGDENVLIEQLADHLSIDINKASEVVDAMNFNKSKINAIIRDKKIGSKERNDKLASLIGEQNLKLKSTLDSTQIESLMVFMQARKTSSLYSVQSMQSRNLESRQKQEANKFKVRKN